MEHDSIYVYIAISIYNLLEKCNKSFHAKIEVLFCHHQSQVRAGIVGYPNVGKSSLINRLLKRRMCPAAPRPGVTRELKYYYHSISIQFNIDVNIN